MSRNLVNYLIFGQFLTYLQNWLWLPNLKSECLHTQIRCTRILIKFYSRIKNYSACNIAIFTSTSIFLLWLGEFTHICVIWYGWVGGRPLHNHATPWFHLASWNLLESQLSWKSKMEPSVAILVSHVDF